MQWVSCMWSWDGWLRLFSHLGQEPRDAGHWPSLISYPFLIFLQQIMIVNVPPEDQDGSGDDSDSFSGSGTGKADPEH